MKNVLMFAAIGLFACCSLWGRDKETAMTLKPLLSHGFGSVLKVGGTLCTGSGMGYNYKGADEEIFIKAETINGSKLSKIVLVPVRPFSAEIGQELVKRSTHGEKVQLVGFESFAGEGAPAEIGDFVDMPQSRDWSVEQFLVVVKCGQVDPSHP